MYAGRLEDSHGKYVMRKKWKVPSKYMWARRPRELAAVPRCGATVCAARPALCRTLCPYSGGPKVNFRVLSVRTSCAK